MSVSSHDLRNSKHVCRKLKPRGCGRQVDSFREVISLVERSPLISSYISLPDVFSLHRITSIEQATSMMAAPANITFENWNATLWAFVRRPHQGSLPTRTATDQTEQNKSLSGDYNSILTLQGVSRIVRKVIIKSRIVVAVKHWKENETTHVELDNRMPFGLPSTKDMYQLDWLAREIKDPVFGNVRDRARWLRLAELEDEFQKDGWEEGTDELMELFTEHADIHATTSQVCGFGTLNGERRYIRRLVVKKGEECRRLLVVFDYVGSEA